MATRLYGRESAAADVSPAPDAGWESFAAPFARKACYKWPDGNDTLTTVTGFSSTTGQDRCHRQWVSTPMAAGNVFNTSVTYKAYAQVLESAVNDNILSRLCVRIVSEDGNTVRATPLSIADYSTATQWNTAIRNKAFANGDAGVGSYTTVDGDRLVIEWGHNDSAGATISGSSRWGTAGTTDLTEDETNVLTTARPWFETSLNIIWKTDIVGVFGTVQSFDGDANIRIRLPVGAVDFTANRTRVRVKIKAGTGSSLVITGVFFGEGATVGDAYDFAATPTRITFTGANGVTIPVSTIVTSDWLTIAVDKTKDYLLSMGASGGSWSATGAALHQSYFLLSGSSSAGTVNVSGYTADSFGNIHIVSFEADSFTAAVARSFGTIVW